ncbi:SIMPL domain-containing protein [Leptospira sp. WS92.C1]
MKKIFTLFLLSTPFLGIISEAKQTIIVSGNGSSIVQIDYIQLTFSVEAEDKDAKVAQEKNFERSAAVIKTLSKSFKIDPKDIYSTDYSLQRIYLEEGKQRPYLSTSGILLKLRNLNLYKDLLLELQKQGLNQVSGIEFKSDKTEKYEKEALVAAYEDAKNKALILVKTIGKKEVRALKIIESDSIQTLPIDHLRSKLANEVQSPISVGERYINARISVEFEVQ